MADLDDQKERDVTDEVFEENPRGKPPASEKMGLALLLDIPLQVTVELGRTRMTIDSLLRLSQGSVVELNRVAGEPLDIYVNNKLMARGEAVVVKEKFGVRITDVLSPDKRLEGLG
jgi:flagellar motor switch protein FliN/FliY